jgi:lysophospholipase L1-like esterase
LSINRTNLQTNSNDPRLARVDINDMFADIGYGTTGTISPISSAGGNDKIVKTNSSGNINIASGNGYYVNNTNIKDVMETMTNKTLTSPTINGGSMNSTSEYQTNGRRAIPFIDVTIHGADNTGLTDCATAFETAKTLAGTDGVVYFPKGTFLFTTSRYDLSGVNIETHPDAVIKIDENPNTKDNKFLNPVTINNPVHGTIYEKSANTKIQIPEIFNIASQMSSMSVNEISSIVDYTTWNHKVYITTTGDISSTGGTGTVTSSQITWATDFTGNPQVVYPTTAVDGTLYEHNIYNASTVLRTGVFVKTSSFIYRIMAEVSNGNIIYHKLNFSGTIVSQGIKALPNGGAYSWSTGQECNIGFVVNSNRATVVMGGLAIFTIPEDVVNVGFILMNTGSPSQVTFRDLIATTNYKLKSKKHIKIGVVGDSISYGAWSSNAIEDILPKMIAGHEGIGSSEVINHAISGSTSGVWAGTYIATVDCSTYNRTLVMLGTNDVQGSQTVANYIANMTTIANKIIADGSVPIFGIFPIYTTSALSGITGVTTQNYAYHAKYTHALKKWCIQNNYEFADVRRNIGTDITLYGDNIHPKLEGQIAFCASYAEAIKRSYNKNIAYFASIV